MFGFGPGRVFEFLDLDQVSRRIADEAVVDIVLGVVLRRFFEIEIVRFQIFIPTIDVGGYESQDGRAFVLRRRHFPADPQKSIGGRLVDPAHPLIQNHLQADDLFVEVAGFFEVFTINEGNELIERFWFHGEPSGEERINALMGSTAQRLRGQPQDNPGEDGYDDGGNDQQQAERPRIPGDFEDIPLGHSLEHE